MHPCLTVAEGFSHIQGTVNAMAAFDLSKVCERMEKKGKSKEEAEDLRIGFVQYCAMAKEMPDTSFIPSGEIDEFWHEAVLHTRTYREFCDKHLGRFLDHEPMPEMEGVDGTCKGPGQSCICTFHGTKEKLVHAADSVLVVFPNANKAIWGIVG